MKKNWRLNLVVERQDEATGEWVTAFFSPSRPTDRESVRDLADSAMTVVMAKQNESE